VKNILSSLLSNLILVTTLSAGQIVQYVESNYNDAGQVNQIVSDLSEQLTMNKNFANIKDPIIAITSFVCLDNFKATTRLSNILSENLIHEMQVRGYKVVDFKMMTNIKVDKDGDFLLSRDIEELRNSLELNYALTGTYTDYKDGTVINARIINLNTLVVLSTAQAFIPKYTTRRITRRKYEIADFTTNSISIGK
jgi:TolB-like protein